MMVITMFAFAAATYYGLSQLFGNYAPDAYMDEIFHYPQTRAYCKGRFDVWDSKITTFPGLYLFGAAASWLVKAVTTANVSLTEADCSLSLLRGINVGFWIGTLWLCYKIFAHLRGFPPKTAMLHACTLSLFPVYYFTGFLYYTDTGSLFFVLLMYILAKQVGQKTQRSCLSYLPSALAGVVAVLFRQNNIIWVLFVLGTEVEHLVDLLYGKGHSRQERAISPPQHRTYKRTYLSVFVRRFEAFLDWLIIPSAARVLVARMWKSKSQLLYIFWPYLYVVAGFAVFIARNGSIVLGDRTHHKMVLHIPQLCYFALVATSPLSLSLFGKDNLKLALGCQNPARMLRVALLAISILVAVSYLSYDHPFMLADNRHYIFYLWKNFFRRFSWAKYSLIPAHTFCISLLSQRLVAAQNTTWLLTYFVAVSLALVPAHLVEFRYFIIPFFMLHLSSPQLDRWSAMLTLAAYALVNLGTIYVFLMRSFKWQDGSVARFMW